MHFRVVCSHTVAVTLPLKGLPFANTERDDRCLQLPSSTLCTIVSVVPNNVVLRQNSVPHEQRDEFQETYFYHEYQTYSK